VRVEERINKGGMTNVGYSLHRNKLGAKIGTMVACNSVHPGGACGGHDGNVTILRATYKTQEESSDNSRGPSKNHV
jgi:hypothetical protein